MSIPKETLLHAYRTMKTIREFEERVNAEIMNGQIPGFTHLYTGQEANAVGVCAHLDERHHHLHPSRPRALHRQRRRSVGHDEGAVWFF